VFSLGGLTLICAIILEICVNSGFINTEPPSDAVRKQKNKNILEDLFNLALSQFKKCHPPGKMKCHYLGIFQRSKLRI